MDWGEAYPAVSFADWQRLIENSALCRRQRLAPVFPVMDSCRKWIALSSGQQLADVHRVSANDLREANLSPGQTEFAYCQAAPQLLSARHRRGDRLESTWVEVVLAVAELVGSIAEAAEFDLDAGAQSLQFLTLVPVRLAALAPAVVPVGALPVVQADYQLNRSAC